MESSPGEEEGPKDPAAKAPGKIQQIKLQVGTTR